MLSRSYSQDRCLVLISAIGLLWIIHLIHSRLDKWPGGGGNQIISLKSVPVTPGNFYLFEMDPKVNSLSEKQWCAIESVAHHHPGAKILVGMNNVQLALGLAGSAVMKKYGGQVQVVHVDPIK